MCKICANILTSKKDVRSWQEQKFDWSMIENPNIKYKYKYLKKDDLDLSYSDKREISTSCICGHEISKCYYVFNDKRKLCYLLGSSCILAHKKNKHTKEKETVGIFAGHDEIAEQLEELQNTTCTVCDKVVKTANYLKHCNSPRHKKNLRMRDYRLCKSCNLYNIDKKSPSYYYKCPKCYESVRLLNLLKKKGKI